MHAETLFPETSSGRPSAIRTIAAAGALPAVLIAIAATGCAGSEPAEELGTTTQFSVSSCPFPPTAIDGEREMVIRYRQVVDDPCRTTWNGVDCPADIRARWTFGYLMAVMSGATSADGSPEGLAGNAVAQLFVGNWLRYWLSDQSVGADPNAVAKRSGIRPQMLNRWFADSGCAVTATTDPTSCRLNLRAAPFRLLAIVNRADMAGFDYATGGSGTGELRFVFGLYDRSAQPAGAVTTVEPGSPKNAEVILEYRLPTSASATEWARQFHNLGTLPLSDTISPTVATSRNAAGFAAALQAITGRVVEGNAQPGAPNNGSSIGQVRTLENQFDSIGGLSPPWEFRQFQFVPPCAGGTCQLTQVPVPQTPPTRANPTNAVLDQDNPNRALKLAEQAVFDFIVDNQNAISRSLHVVPAAMLGGSSLARAGDLVSVWAYPSPVTTGDAEWNALVRHNFAIGTCNGCHYPETGNELGVFHIKPRELNASSALSTFLLSSTASADGVTPNYYQPVPDPADGSPRFKYNEPWRRTCELRRLLVGNPLPFTTATGHGFSQNLAAPSHSVARLAFGTTIPPSDPGTMLTPGVFHGYEFGGRTGGVVTVTMNAATCGQLDTYLYLYGPRDAASGNWGLVRAQSDDAGIAPCTRDSQIKSFRLPADGSYLILATSFSQVGTGTYRLQLSCESGNCAL